MSLNSHWFQNGQPSKLEKRKKVRLSTPLLRRISFTHFQLGRLAVFEPVGVQRHNVPHFNGLIVLYLNSRSLKAWQHFYCHGIRKRPFLHLKRPSAQEAMFPTVHANARIDKQTCLLK